ncbi:MAG: PKD domain-containing protein [Halobacteriota archaeon]
MISINKASLTGAIVAFIAAAVLIAGCANSTSQSNSAQQFPIANAGVDQKVKVGSVVTLDGSDSSAPRGGTLIYGWSLIAVPKDSAAHLSNQTSDRPTFTPDKVGTYIVSLVVANGAGTNSTPDTTNVTVIPAERSDTTLTVNPSSKTDLYLGDQVVISGRLVDAEGYGIPNQTISFKNVAHVLGFTTEWPMNDTTTDNTGAFTTLPEPLTRHNAPSFIRDVDVEAWAVFAGNDFYKPATTLHEHLNVHLTSPPRS